MPTPEIKYQSDNILKLTKKSLCANVHILVGVFHTDQAYLIFPCPASYQEYVYLYSFIGSKNGPASLS